MILELIPSLSHESPSKVRVVLLAILVLWQWVYLLVEPVGVVVMDFVAVQKDLLQCCVRLRFPARSGQKELIAAVDFGYLWDTLHC
jgi:hypothetical protein